MVCYLIVLLAGANEQIEFVSATDARDLTVTWQICPTGSGRSAVYPVLMNA